VGSPGWVKTWSHSDTERREIEYRLHRAVNLEGTFACPTFQSTLDHQRAVEISFDRVGVKIHTVFHQVEYLAAAYTGVASQNRSGTQGVRRVVDPFPICRRAENVVGFTLRSLVPRILLDDWNLLNELQLAVGIPKRFA
jgi:hypothetical protein